MAAKIDETIVKKIIKLRQNGEPVKRIAKIVGCSSSTASKYCQDVNIDNIDRHNKICNDTKRENALAASDVAREKWRQRRDEVKRAAKSEWNEIKSDPLMVAFLGLYAGEGKKTTSTIGISNNDPRIIRLSLKAIRKLDPNKTLSARVVYYESHNPDECMKFWREIFDENVKIKLVKNSDNRCQNLSEPHKRCTFGRCDLEYNKFRTYWRIMQWIDCMYDM